MCSNVKFIAAAALALFSAACTAIVVHPDGEPASDWTGRPSNNVLGRWNSNASCVVMSPGCVITTKHQGGVEGSIVEIGGTAYKVVRISNHATADVRVAKLRYASLSDYVPLNTTTSESGRSVVLGGFGMKRGTELTTLGTVWGYQWTGNNQTIGWCTNDVDTVVSSGGFNYLIVDFDALGRRATAYEGIIAAYDSGGGVFYDTGSQWILMGLNYGVSLPDGYSNVAYFKSPNLLTDTQTGSFHKVSDYAAWANDAASALSQCGSAPADIDEDCRVNEADLKELGKYWGEVNPSGDAANSDTDADGVVNMLDFVNIYKSWGTDYF